MVGRFQLNKDTAILNGSEQKLLGDISFNTEGTASEQEQPQILNSEEEFDKY
ncbi:MAG: hypothetical protein AAGU75_20770 [Bacillota bacterium]